MSELRRLRTFGVALICLAPALSGLLPGEAGEPAGEGPFHPSAASTRDGGPVPVEVFTESQSCGRSGCHPDVVAEWSSSAHRFSGLDNPWYRATLDQMRQETGPVPTRWCAGCHTPALLLSGNADRPSAEMAQTPAGQAGVSCTACHGISRVKSTTGEGAYELAPPRVSGRPDGRNPIVQKVNDLWLRLNPGPHRRAYRLSLPAGQAAAELCSTCHDGYVGQAVNQGGSRSYAVLTDFEAWRQSSVSGHGYRVPNHFAEPRSCVDCHMPGVASRDAGHEGGRIRSHRFAAANTALPALRGDREQLEAVTRSLTAGHVTVDLFAMVADKAYAPLDRLPATVRRGQSVRLDVMIRNRGVGHLFPGGKYDLHDCWLELRGVDSRGRTVFWNGRPEKDAAAPASTRRFRTVWLDESARILERHEVWKVRGEASISLISPGGVSIARYRLEVPADTGDRITLTARLHHRKFRPELTRWAFSALSLQPPDLPVVVLAEDSVALQVVDAGGALPDMDNPALQPETDLERLRDYGFGLLAQGDALGARAALQRVLALDPDHTDVEVSLGAVLRREGDAAGARALYEKILQRDPRAARAHFALAVLDRQEGRYDSAIQHLRAAVASFPDDSGTRTQLGAVLAMNGDYTAAVAELSRAVALDPKDYEAHYSLMLSYSALGDRQSAERHRALYERAKPGTPQERAVVSQFFSTHPGGLPGARTELRSLPPEQLPGSPSQGEGNRP